MIISEAFWRCLIVLLALMSTLGSQRAAAQSQITEATKREEELPRLSVRFSMNGKIHELQPGRYRIQREKNCDTDSDLECLPAIRVLIAPEAPWPVKVSLDVFLIHNLGRPVSMLPVRNDQRHWSTPAVGASQPVSWDVKWFEVRPSSVKHRGPYRFLFALPKTRVTVETREFEFDFD